MMNNYERRLFSQLLEVNYRIKTGDYDSIIKTALTTHYRYLEDQIKDSMGKDEYKAYVDGMRKMFAPVGGYGDESPEEVERMMVVVSR